MKESEPDRAEVAFHPPVLLAGLFAVGFVARWLVPAEFLPEPWTLLIGAPAVVLALALFAWAVVTMRREGASIPTGEPTGLIVVRGPYRFSRNPIYFSMVLLLVAVGVWANSVWFLLFAVGAAGLLSWGVIRPEERYLERKFGDRYGNYKTAVRRWI